ncbi:MAG: aldehyde ferredoxin oxidoreductase C-terminal domain-containing protein, partial [Termitinemataceae bacterium]
GVRFEAAGDLWGMEISPVQDHLVDNSKKGALVIGPAGENRVLYACIRSGHRFLGRGGMGAVMGSKRIKAIVATGMSKKILPVDLEGFTKHRKKAQTYILRNPLIQSYRAYGTNYNINPGIDSGYVPVRNFRDRTDERFHALSGQAMAERYKTTHAVCNPCIVLCGHKGTYPDGKVRPIPEYETTGVWGGNIMNFNPDLIGRWNERMNELGIDTISCGVTVSWAMEAAERGVRPSSLAFGKTDNIETIIDDIGYGRGEGVELGLGTRRLAQKYGGLEFAAQVKGLELAAYDPRAGWGQGLNYAVANRGGCHLNAFPIALEGIFHYIPQYAIRSKVSWVCMLEDLFSAINSTQTCVFSIFGYLLEPPLAKYTPKPLLKLTMTWMPAVAQLVLNWKPLSGMVSAITGYKLGMREYLQIGRRVHVLERYMNVQCGVNAADDTLPERFLKEAVTKHPVPSTVPIEKLVQAYYRKKGYDRQGVPKPSLLKALGIKSLNP